jgi:hypothetical protein
MRQTSKQKSVHLHLILHTFGELLLKSVQYQANTGVFISRYNGIQSSRTAEQEKWPLVTATRMLLIENIALGFSSGDGFAIRSH